MTTIKPANRVNEVQEYYFSRKQKEIVRLNAQGQDIISLAIGSPDMPPSKNAIDRLCQVAQDPNAHGYQPIMGTPELRQAMARFYKKWFDVDLDPATEIQPLIGSKEGMLHVTLAFCNVGDKVLVPNPGYPTYTSLTKMLGCQVVNYNLVEDNDWQPDFEQLEHMDLDGVKLMWTNYPNMPTGGKAKRETLEWLVNFAKKNNIVVVNDNPYPLILSKEHLSLLQIPGAKDHCIEFNSMSKSHNMAGWRVGLAASNATFISWILKMKSNIDTGTFRAIQLAAAEAYDNNTPEWHEEYNYNNYKRRRIIAEQIMTELGCTFNPNQVGMFLWGKIPENIANVEDLTERVLHQARVFITPGFIFGSNGNRFIRITLCAKEERLEEALNRIRQMNKQH